MKSFVMFLSLLLPFTGFSQWSWVHPTPQGNTLHDVQFVDATTGIGVGDCGTILKSDDGGQTWLTMTSNTLESLNAVFFLDQDNGFAISNGESGLYRTTDGGQNWSLLYTFETFHMWDVWFRDAMHGTATGDECVFITNDGGITWSWKGPYTWNYSVWYTSPSTAVMSSEGYLYKSYDGGNTWTIKQQNVYGWLGSLFFLNADTGLFVGRVGQIYRTTDGGETWSLGPILTGQPLSAAYILPSGTGYIVGYAGKMLKTTDFGVSWSALPQLTDHNLETITFSDSHNGIITGEQGLVMRSIDGGDTWMILSSSLTEKRLNSIWFTDPNTGYIAGDTATLLKTIDGGDTWQTISFPGISDLNAVRFTDPQTGFVAGSGGMIYKTTNGGATWSSLHISDRDLDELDFPDDVTGYVHTYSNSIGDSLFLFKTTDAGTTWSSHPLGMLNSATMEFTSPDTGYMAGYDGWIRRTTDGGNTWSEVASFPGLAFYDLCFPTKSHGFACGANAIYETMNAGNTWQLIYSGPLRFTRMKFTDPLNGYATDSHFWWNHTIFKTMDGGITWSQNQVDISCNFLHDFYFTDPETGFLAGERGVILKTTNSGGIITSVNGEYGTVNSETGVLIFPNPAHDRITVRLPENSPSAVVRAFSILGREVASATGTNSCEVVIDLHGLPPGTYIARITTAGSVVTRKFVVERQ